MRNCLTIMNAELGGVMRLYVYRNWAKSQNSLFSIIKALVDIQTWYCLNAW